MVGRRIAMGVGVGVGVRCENGREGGKTTDGRRRLGMEPAAHKRERERLILFSPRTHTARLKKRARLSNFSLREEP